MLLKVALATLVVSLLPEGWVTLKTPSATLLNCGGYSKQAWRVSLRDGGAQIEPETQPERSTGPVVSVSLPGRQFPGHRHTLAVKGGFLVGTDAGEWGGGLFWVKEGGAAVKLAEENVQALVPRGEAVLVLQGLNHMGLNRGMARWLERTADGGWKVAATTALDAGPQTFVATRDAVYVITPTSLTRIGAERQVAVVQPLQLVTLYPSSMVADTQGVLWVGMRHFVLRLTPDGSRFTEEWLTPKGCDKALLQNNSCVCAK